MPFGAPGIEGPDPKPYDVLAIDQEAKTSVYAVHEPVTPQSEAPEDSRE